MKKNKILFILIFSLLTQINKTNSANLGTAAASIVFFSTGILSEYFIDISPRLIEELFNPLIPNQIQFENTYESSELKKEGMPQEIYNDIIKNILDGLDSIIDKTIKRTIQETIKQLMIFISIYLGIDLYAIEELTFEVGRGIYQVWGTAAEIMTLLKEFLDELSIDLINQRNLYFERKMQKATNLTDEEIQKINIFNPLSSIFSELPHSGTTILPPLPQKTETSTALTKFINIVITKTFHILLGCLVAKAAFKLADKTARITQLLPNRYTQRIARCATLSFIRGGSLKGLISLLKNTNIASKEKLKLEKLGGMLFRDITKNIPLFTRATREIAT